MPVPDSKRKSSLSEWISVRFLMVGIFAAVLAACKPAEPTLEFIVDADTEQFSISTLRGQVVLLDFWATWCGPCRDSFPWMSEMQNKYGDDGLKVIALSLDTNRAMAHKFAEELSANFTIGFDATGDTANLFEVRGMPTSVVIGRDGRLATTHVGFSEDKIADYEASIVAALKK